MALSPNVLKYAQKMLSVDKEVDKATVNKIAPESPCVLIALESFLTMRQ